MAEHDDTAAAAASAFPDSIPGDGLSQAMSEITAQAEGTLSAGSVDVPFASAESEKKPIPLRGADRPLPTGNVQILAPSTPPGAPHGARDVVNSGPRTRTPPLAVAKGVMPSLLPLFPSSASFLKSTR